MSCRRPTTKKSTRKSKSCCNTCYDSSSSSYSSDSSYTSSDSSCDSSDCGCSDCGCSDCDYYDRDCCNSPPKRRSRVAKAKGRNLQPKKSLRTSKPPSGVAISRKKPARRTKKASSGCGYSKCDCSDARNSDNEYGSRLDWESMRSLRKPRI